MNITLKHTFEMNVYIYIYIKEYKIVNKKYFRLFFFLCFLCIWKRFNNLLLLNTLTDIWGTETMITVQADHYSNYSG